MSRPYNSNLICRFKESIVKDVYKRQIPSHPSLIKAKDMDLDRQKKSLIRVNLRKYGTELTEEDYKYLCEETKKDMDWVKAAVEEVKAAL